MTTGGFGPVPTPSIGNRSPREWLVADGPMTWRSRGFDQAMVLKPFYQGDSRYTVYWQTV